MYLWKYWRESRILFLAVVAINIGLFVHIWQQRIAITTDLRPLSGLFIELLFFQAVPFGFLAWLFGIFGIGHDLGENSGSFLFTRPVKRAYFVWRDWGFGMAQLLILTALTNLVNLFQVRRMFIAAGDPWHGGIPFSDGIVHPLTPIFCITTMIVFLLAALIFSLTYFCTVAIKNARGMMLSAGVLVGYLFVALRIKDIWPNAELPSLVIQQFTMSRGMIAGFADHLWLSMTIRAGIVLLFPICAQFVLQKLDV